MNLGDIEYLCASITPSNATNQTVTWCSSNENVATVGLYTGKVTAKKAGTTTITATTVDGGCSASCTVTVFIDTVTIQKDGYFNKVVFNKSGKVWRCINRDLIFNDNDDGVNSIWEQRSKQNFYTYYNENDPVMSNTIPKEYTDEEIKLLYAIDPYGVAHYVKKYADSLFGDEGLEGVLGYKDRIFGLLFGREPKYFARTLDGLTWYETTDKGNLSAVQSESESVFGMHPIWDSYTFLQIIEAAATMVDIAFSLAFAAPKVASYLRAHKTANTIAKIFSFTASSIGSGFISASTNEFIENAFEGTSLSWAYDIVSTYSSLYELVSDFDLGENYYRQVFDYCTTELQYKIYVELQNGQKYQLTEIQDLMGNN